MSHPTINIIEQPSSSCPLPAYNGIKYCFQSTEFQTAIGTRASFSIKLSGPILTVIPPTIDFFEVAGFSFNVGNSNTYNTLDTSATYTQAEFAVNLKEMFEANDSFFQRYTFSIVSDALVATARENKLQSDFTFDYSNFPTSGNSLITSEANGTIDQYRSNYRIIAQIWQCDLDEPLYMVSEEAYQVNSIGQVCIDTGLKIAPLLETRFVHDRPTNVAYYTDELITKFFLIRYGESYSESSLTCESESKSFATTDCIRVYNGAFQRDEVVLKNDIVCNVEFMTNTPDYTDLCEDSIAYLWINLWDIVQFPPPSSTNYFPHWEIFYTDGTSDAFVGTQLTVNIPDNKMYAIAAGFKSIAFNADPLKKVDSWRVRVLERDSAAPLDTFYGSQYFNLSSCCEGDVEFVFLNEYGAYDTMQFTQIDDIVFQNSNAVFESFLEPQQEDSLRGGQDIVDQFSNDVYTVTSKFTNYYGSIAWIREFLNSPKKYIRSSVDGQEKKINKVLVAVDGVQYSKNKDNTVYLRLSYRINEDLNQQKN
jgi:hypothetical protein